MRRQQVNQSYASGVASANGFDPLERRILFAAAPPYDNTFGTDGRARLDVFGLIENAMTVSVAPDGKIILTGDVQVPAEPDPSGLLRGTGPQFRNYVARLNPDGTPDASFGDGGVVTLVNAPLGHFGYIGAGPAAGQADGKVLVLGGLHDPLNFNPPRPDDGSPGMPPGQVGPAMLRLNADGTLDTSFGGDGMATLFTGARVNFFSKILPQPDGRIFAIGYLGTGDYEAGDADDMLVIRLNADGSPDATFGGGDGIQTIGIDEGRATFDRAITLLVQPDGKLLLGGSSELSGSYHGDSRFALARLNADGSLDTTFGDGGTVVARSADHDPSETWVGPTHSDVVHDLALTADGKILAVGVGGNLKRLGILRLTGDGDLDTTFGTNGIVSRLALENAAYDVTAEPDGSLTVRGVGSGNNITPLPVEGGFAYEHRHGGAQVFAGRFDAVGRLVESRTATGLLDREREFTYAYAFAHGAAFQADGRILTAGIYKRPWSEAPEGAQGSDWNQADALVARFDLTGLEPDRDPERALGDNVATVPMLSGRTVVRKGRAYKFRVTFARPEDANASSVLVSGPNGFSAEATRTSLRRARGGRYVATYTVSPSDGRFDAGDNGTYTLRLRDTVAATTTGAQTAEDSLLGTFTVQAARRRRPVLQ